jgi:hypothetical protein
MDSNGGVKQAIARRLAIKALQLSRNGGVPYE